ncbi:MAG: hypothetical protein Q8M95_16645 [Candidatus Methanoperedens sp.]|nr:hypothetical protein [Candidatus Methanoperedens sp.]
MISKVVIDNKFIEEWSPQYDEAGIGDDYAEYDSIRLQVSKEVSNGTISKPTFIRILDWKAPRVKGKIKGDFEYYADGFRLALQSPEERRLAVLDDLQGIGVPVASTILHFIYPSVFSIMDVRVTEALFYSGYLKAKLRSQNNYANYRRVILNLVQLHKCSTRELDKALFAYHKKELEPSIKKGKTCLEQ